MQSQRKMRAKQWTDVCPGKFRAPCSPVKDPDLADKPPPKKTKTPQMLLEMADA